VLGLASNANSAYNLFKGSGSLANFLGIGSTADTISGATSSALGLGDASYAAMDYAASTAAATAATGEAAVAAGELTATIGETAGAMSSLSTALAAVPGWGWAALAATALIGLSGGGETRSGGGYAVVNGKAQFMGGPDGGEIAGDGVRALIDAYNTSIQDTLKQLGSSSVLNFFNAGLESSQNGKGGTFAGGALNGIQFGDTDLTKNYHQNLSPEEAVKQLGADLQKAYLEAIQAAADIPKSIADKLNGVDIKSMTADAAASLLTTIQTQIAGVKSFQSALETLPFDNLKQLSFDAASGLITLAGGIDKLTSGTQYFLDNFLTDDEKVAQAAKQIAPVLSQLGAAGITTREQFKSLVQSLDLTTAAGQQAYVNLMNIAPAFVTVADAATKAADAAKQAAMDAVNSAFSGLQKAVDAEKQAAQAQYDNAIAATKDQIDSVNESISKLSSLSSSLKSTIDSMRLPSQLADDKAAARAQIQTAIALAKAGGVFPDSADLQSALSIISQPNEELYSSLVDFQRSFLQDKNSVSELAGLTNDKLSIEQQTLKSLEDQQKAIEDGFKAETDRLDGILASAQAQIDAINGVQTAVLSIRDAIAAFNKASVGAGGGTISMPGEPSSSMGDKNTQFVESLYGQYLNRASDAPGLAYWVDKLQNGTSVGDVIQGFLNSDEFHRIHGFAVGTNYVPNDMVAQIHQGERIIPAADNRELMARLRSPSESNAALLEELRALRAEVAQLRETNSAENVSIAQHASKTAKTLQRAMQGGNALTVQVEAA
jgi:hypothetical protein